MLLLFHKERDVGVSHILSFRIRIIKVSLCQLTSWNGIEKNDMQGCGCGLTSNIHAFQISSQSPVHVALSVAADRTTTKPCLRMHFEHETSGNLSVPTLPAISRRSNVLRLLIEIRIKKKMPTVTAYYEYRLHLAKGSKWYPHKSLCFATFACSSSQFAKHYGSKNSSKMFQLLECKAYIDLIQFHSLKIEEI